MGGLRSLRAFSASHAGWAMRDLAAHVFAPANSEGALLRARTYRSLEPAAPAPSRRVKFSVRLRSIE